MKKSLVILAGIPRGGKTTWESIYKNLVLSEDADLALCTEKNSTLDTGLKEKAKYLWLFNSYEDWRDYYIENKLFLALDYLALGKDTGLYNSGIVVFAFGANTDLFVKYIHLILLIVLAHNALGILTGFSLATMFKLPSADQKTLAIETGIQNSGLGLGLIFAFFENILVQICYFLYLGSSGD